MFRSLTRDQTQHRGENREDHHRHHESRQKRLQESQLGHHARFGLIGDLIEATSSDPDNSPTSIVAFSSSLSRETR